MTERTIAIIGAGYSGTALALNLLRQTSPATRIVLIERGGAFGLGRAYATTSPAPPAERPRRPDERFRHPSQPFP